VLHEEPEPAWGDAECLDGDVNGDGELNLSDPVHLLQFLFLGGSAPVSCETPSTPVSTVMVIRHAEKSPDGADPGLTAEGQERAQELVRILARAGVDFLVASDLRRTHETLEPLAAFLELPVEQIAEPADVVAYLNGLPAGSLALVAHHSYTIPSILSGLEVDPEAVEDLSFGGGNYDNLLILLRRPDAPVQVLPLKYGPSP
jgi:hypothetical protein